jgi:hypothetical protein
MSRSVVIVFTALLLSGCGAFNAPAPTAEAMDDVIANLVVRGVTVHQLVSGDAGCPEASLHDNAVRLDISLPNEPGEYSVYLLRWRRPTDYDAAAQLFADCVASFSEAHSNLATTVIEADPWRAYGPVWPPAVESTLREALLASGGG